MLGPLFLSLDSARLANEISRAEQSVCYTAPGIFPEPANALAWLARRIGPELITVCLDFGEHVMRMGFGTLDSVKTLREAGIEVRSTPGLRTGLVIIDDLGYIFTPTALYLEPEERSDAAPNAMRLAKDQITEALARLSPAAKAIAIAFAKTEEEREWIREQAVEVPSVKVADTDFAAVKKQIDEAPPVQFDVARQVRVFSAYLQYVELKLSGAAIQRHRLAIPPSIQKLGGSKDIEGRLKTTFDLIEKGGKLSSKKLEQELNEIRRNFTPSLGKNHGRVLLKAQKANFEKRIEAFKADLTAHQTKVADELQGQLDESRKQIVDYYLPRVQAMPPDAMLGQLLNDKPTEEDSRRWLEAELYRVFPKAEALIQKMQLDVQYKDVTFETLNHEGFLASVKEAFPRVDWDKTYHEFKAAAEKEP